MPGPQNGIMGQDDVLNPDTAPTESQDAVVEEGLQELRAAAAFAKSPEFQTLKEHLLSRIAFYQTYLPDGTNVLTKNPNELGHMWMAANVIVGECRSIISSYEQAAAQLQDGRRETT